MLLHLLFWWANQMARAWFFDAYRIAGMSLATTTLLVGLLIFFFSLPTGTGVAADASTLAASQLMP